MTRSRRAGSSSTSTTTPTAPTTRSTRSRTTSAPTRTGRFDVLAITDHNRIDGAIERRRARLVPGHRRHGDRHRRRRADRPLPARPDPARLARGRDGRADPRPGRPRLPPAPVLPVRPPAAAPGVSARRLVRGRAGGRRRGPQRRAVHGRPDARARAWAAGAGRCRSAPGATPTSRRTSARAWSRSRPGPLEPAALAPAARAASSSTGTAARSPRSRRRRATAGSPRSQRLRGEPLRRFPAAPR